MKLRYQVLISPAVMALIAINSWGQMSTMDEGMSGMSTAPEQNMVLPDSGSAKQAREVATNVEHRQNVYPETPDSTLKPQTNCPIMGGVIDKKLFVDYKNLRIHICCERCRPLVKSQPENALQQLKNLGQRPEVRKHAIAGTAKKSPATDQFASLPSQPGNTVKSIEVPSPLGAMQMDATMDMGSVRSARTNENNVVPTRQTGTPRTVVYRLSIGDTTVNYTGKKRRALAINGSIPAPTLTFTEGDTAEIYIHNSLKTETSIHWHGLIVPNHYDGVPYLTTAPIAPGQMRMFKFSFVQNGTYWYHSHTGLQEQLGMYGAFIVKKRDGQFSNEHVVLLSDWTDENPHEIYRNLSMGSDWYAIKRGSTQSFGEALAEGYFGTKFINTFKRMTAMDVGDVYYDKALVNGTSQHILADIKIGEKVKLRIINGSASSYYWLNYAGGPITIVASDGKDVEPVTVDRLTIGAAETYDVIVTVPDAKCYEFMATSEDRTISSSVWLGMGPKVSLKPLLRLKYFEGMKAMNGMVRLNGRLDDKGMKSSLQQMDMNTVMYPELTTADNFDTQLLNGSKKAPEATGTDTNKGMTSQILAAVPEKPPEMSSMPGMVMDMGVSSDSKPNAKTGQPADPMVGMDMVDKQSPSAKMTDMPGMHMSVKNNGLKTLNYAMLRSSVKTTLPPGPLRILEFRLTGNMSRYVWTMDSKKISERDKILIRKGENVRILLYNGTMMRHPMHLHGHFFRVVNGQGDYAPLKTVLDILPAETDTIEFAASEEGDWSFHCHILYHMMSGMGVVFSYEHSPANPEFADAKMAYRKFRNEDKSIHMMAQIGLESNGTMGELALSTTRYALQGEWRVGVMPDVTVETETHLGRYLGEKQWWFPYVGTDWRYDKSAQTEENLFGQKFLNDNRVVFCAGLQYTAPFLLRVDARIDHKGLFRLQLGQNDLPITSRLRLNWVVNTNREYSAGLSYILAKYFSISMHYDSDMKWGAGIRSRY